MTPDKPIYLNSRSKSPFRRVLRGIAFNDIGLLSLAFLTGYALEAGVMKLIEWAML